MRHLSEWRNHNGLRALGVLFSRDLVIFKGPLYHSSTENISNIKILFQLFFDPIS